MTTVPGFFFFRPELIFILIVSSQKRLERKELQHDLETCLRQCRGDVHKRQDDLCNNLKQDGIDMCDRDYDGLVLPHCCLLDYNARLSDMKSLQYLDGLGDGTLHSSSSSFSDKQRARQRHRACLDQVDSIADECFFT